MGNLIKAGRLFFVLCIAGLAGQQVYYGEFRPVFVPTYTTHFPGEIVLVYLFTAALVATALAIATGKRARTASLLLGFLFLALFLFCHVPFETWVDPAGGHIGAWNNAFKESAFAGAAFIVAGSYPGKPDLVGLGRVLFAATMIIFGVEHFLFAEFVKALVPGWIPGELFWTYFAGAALIAAGVGFITGIQLRLAGLLLGTAIFIWFLVLHIPRAAVAPVSDNGNELTSVFESLGYSGIAFLLAYGHARPVIRRMPFLQKRPYPQ